MIKEDDMKLRRVNPHSIKVPEVRVTAHFDEELRERFGESIKAIGQLSPPLVYEVGEELVLCDGLHRLEEAIANGESTVEVAVLPGDMMDVLTKNLVVDHLRGKPYVSEMVTVFRVLYQDYNLDPDQISEKTGYPRNYIEKLLKIGEASSVVQEALDQGWIGVGHAFEISRLPYAVQQEEVIAKQRVYGFRVVDLKELVDNTLREMEQLKTAPPSEKPPGVTRKVEYACEGCHEVIEPRYLRPVMLCPECFGRVWRLAKVEVEPKVTSQEQ